MIDYLAKKNAAQKGVQDILDARPQGINDELGDIRGNVEASRDQALGSQFQGALGSIAQGYNLPTVQQADTSYARRGLDQKLNANLAQTKLAQSRGLIGNQMDQNTSLAANANQERMASDSYARQTQDALVAQKQQEWMNNTEIQQAQRRAQIEKNYADQGVALQDQYTPKNDYQAALMRVLVGLPAQLGSAYILQNQLNKSTPSPSGDTPAPIASQVPYGPQPKPYGPYNPYSIGGY